MYDFYDGNARAALRIYHYWYSDWRLLNVFAVIYYSLMETGVSMSPAYIDCTKAHRIFSNGDATKKTFMLWKYKIVMTYCFHPGGCNRHSGPT
jgi:hypothetical protein